MVSKICFFGSFPRSWRDYTAPGGLLESFPPILVPLRVRCADLWPETLEGFILSVYGDSRPRKLSLEVFYCEEFDVELENAQTIHLYLKCSVK